MADNIPQTVTFTREEFYEKVWSKSTVEVARELGRSDSMIGKICKAYDIPKPYLGYWARVQHKQKPPKTPLPKNDDPKLQRLEFSFHPQRLSDFPVPDPEEGYDADIREMLAKARRLPPIKIALALHQPHPWVVIARRNLEISHMPWDKRPDLPQREDAPLGFWVAAAEKLESRALRILDALAKRVEQVGGSFETKTGGWRNDRHRVILFGGEEVSRNLFIREKMSRVEIPQEKREYSFSARSKLVPTGLLWLEDSDGAYSPTVWLRDTPKGRRIEDGLTELVIRWLLAAGEARVERRKQEAAMRVREEQARIQRLKDEELQRRRDELKARQDAESERVEELTRYVKSWQRSQEIRAYLEALQRMIQQRDGKVPQEGPIAEYLVWAKQQADRLDPLMPSPPSVLDETIE